MTSPAALRTFRFVWSRLAQGSRWYPRNVQAATLAQAAQVLHAHIEGKLGIAAGEYAVDHSVQEFAAGPLGQQSALHSLTGEPQDFKVHYKNQAWNANTRVPTDT